MKNICLTLFLFVTISSVSAQEINHTSLSLKGYVSLIVASGNGNGNNTYYGLDKMQIAGPAFGLAFIRSGGNYHQIELSDIAFSVSNALIDGKVTTGQTGVRYSYNFQIIKSRDARLKMFLAPSAHLLVNFTGLKWSETSSSLPNYAVTKNNFDITTELEILPVISYQVSSCFSLEANFPLALIGNTLELQHLANPVTGDSEYHQYENPFLGPLYFQFRVGGVFNF